MGLAFYDKHGKPVAYSEDEMIYLYSGEPVGYLDDNSVYSFTGLHLGWFENGWVLDHYGRHVYFTEEAEGGPARPARWARPARGAKWAKPAKGAKSAKPARPALSSSWSSFECDSFFRSSYLKAVVRYQKDIPFTCFTRSENQISRQF